jgi:hypothetical protein
MGYEFALDDKARLRYIERLESKAFYMARKKPVPEDRRDELEGLVKEIVELTQERYKLINDRRAEMGISALRPLSGGT